MVKDHLQNTHNEKTRRGRGVISAVKNRLKHQENNPYIVTNSVQVNNGYKIQIISAHQYPDKKLTNNDLDIIFR